MIAGPRASRGAALGALVLLAALATPGAAHAQRARGDSLLAAGRPFEAESAYYDAARAAPRDPAARLALGRYLVARGATRVGAVLLEEARYFGGEPLLVARELAPAYERLGDWKALAALPAPPLSAGERERAAWLVEHAPTRTGPDEAAAPYAADASAPLGRLTLRVGGAEVVAEVDPGARGLVLPATVAANGRAGVRTFGDAISGRQAGVAAAVRLGPLSLGNVPVTVAAGERTARVGLDLLASLAPTFDAAAGRATVRRDGRVPADAPGTHVSTYIGRGGADVVIAGRLTGLGTPRGAAVVSGARWTLDGRRGEIVVAR